MKKSFLTILAVVFVFGFTAMFTACGGDTANGDGDAEATTEMEETTDEPVAEEPAEDFTAIAEYYAGTCVACHGANGEGNEAMKSPALVNDIDADKFKKAITEGVEGTTMQAYPDADADMLVKYFQKGLGK